MKVIIGLGNPGKKYKNTRHNVGWMVLDKMAEKEKLHFKKSVKYKSMLAKKSYDEEVIFAKPLTFMNNSGQVFYKLLNVYKVPLGNFLVVYDDMDLALGRIKFSRKGSSGGHKGMASIIESVGTREISRLRVGISKPSYPERTDYVLSDFSDSEKVVLNNILDKSACGCLDWIRFGIKFVMQKYNVKKEGENGKIL